MSGFLAGAVPAQEKLATEQVINIAFDAGDLQTLDPPPGREHGRPRRRRHDLQRPGPVSSGRPGEGRARSRTVLEGIPGRKGLDLRAPERRLLPSFSRGAERLRTDRRRRGLLLQTGLRHEPVVLCRRVRRHGLRGGRRFHGEDHHREGCLGDPLPGQGRKLCRRHGRLQEGPRREGDDWFKTHPVGTGPFLLETYEPRQKTVLGGQSEVFPRRADREESERPLHPQRQLEGARAADRGASDHRRPERGQVGRKGWRPFPA